MRTAPHLFRAAPWNYPMCPALVAVAHPVGDVHVFHELRHEHQRREPDDAVTDGGRGAATEDLRQLVGVPDGHDGPVEAADDDKEEPEGLEPLDERHSCLL